MAFIVKKDFYTVYTSEDFDKLIGDNESIWQDQLPRTIEDIKAYLRARYDVEKIFAEVKDFDIATAFLREDRIIWEETAYDSTATYNTDDLVSYSTGIYQAKEDAITGAFDSDKWTLLGTDGDFYTCIKDSTGNLPSDTEFFSNTDSRNAKIVEITVDFMLYNLMPRLNNVDIPKIRNERYDGDRNNMVTGAKGWLNDVNKGKLQPDLPIRIEGELDQTGNVVIFGDAEQTKRRHYAF